MVQSGQQASPDRNYGTISPSARSLLLLKGLTNIPFAKQAAELMMAPEQYRPDFANRDAGFWARVLHFEMRYWSIDQLMDGVPAKNVLELSSGFSFRGLDRTQREGIHYIDTDLPEVIAAKRTMIQSLQPSLDGPGNLELLPLNALDESQFLEIVDRFPQGELVILNEGLLMYLDAEEKKKLCRIIHRALSERGGYWITADIYLSKKMDGFDLTFRDQEKEFFKQHRIDENKFSTFEAAAEFFRHEGFELDREATTDRSKLSSLKYLLKSTSVFRLLKYRRQGKIQATWRLRPAAR